jgi:hypothetical protein
MYFPLSFRGFFASGFLAVTVCAACFEGIQAAKPTLAGLA